MCDTQMGNNFTVSQAELKILDVKALSSCYKTALGLAFSNVSAANVLPANTGSLL